MNPRSALILNENTDRKSGFLVPGSWFGWRMGASVAANLVFARLGNCENWANTRFAPTGT
jgi:hypothetical protein